MQENKKQIPYKLLYQTNIYFKLENKSYSCDKKIHQS